MTKALYLHVCMLFPRELIQIVHRIFKKAGAKVKNDYTI